MRYLPKNCKGEIWDQLYISIHLISIDIGIYESSPIEFRLFEQDLNYFKIQQPKLKRSEHGNFREKLCESKAKDQKECSNLDE